MFSSKSGDVPDAVPLSEGTLNVNRIISSQVEREHQAHTSISPIYNDLQLRPTSGQEASVEFFTKSVGAVSNLIASIKRIIRVDTNNLVESNATGDDPQCRNVNLQRQNNENEGFYIMSRQNRGCFIIFTQEKFDLYNVSQDRKNHIHPKNGSSYDAKILGETAGKLGFENILIVTNAVKWQILAIIKLLSKFDHSDSDCFCCAILTHAGRGDALYARDAELHLTDFTKPFKADNCTSLVEKPKLFFTQAAIKEEPIAVTNARGPDNIDGPISQPTDDREVTVPTEADFLIVRSTVADSTWRTSTDGSHFIKTLCSFLCSHGDTQELVKILTRVNNEVARKLQPSSTTHIPAIVTRLTAAVYFRLKRELRVGQQVTPSSMSPRFLDPPPSASRDGDRLENAHEGSSADNTIQAEQGTSISLLQQHHGAGVAQCNIDSYDRECQYKIKRGRFIIFNQKKFTTYNKRHKEKGPLSKRTGTNKDASDLKKTFQKLGFEVLPIVKNATYSQIKKKIKKLSEFDHSDYDCFGCAILTHGGNDDVLYAEDRPMHLKHLTRPFCAASCPSLAGKPKLFFIQACRGCSFDPGVKVRGQSVPDATIMVSRIDKKFDLLEPTVAIPIEADFLIANSTVPEYISWRNIDEGSCFIQSLCSVLNTNGKTTELMKIMTLVNWKVAYGFESEIPNDKEYDKKKQISSIASRLSREVYFKDLPQQQERRGRFWWIRRRLRLSR